MTKKILSFLCNGIKLRFLNGKQDCKYRSWKKVYIFLTLNFPCVTILVITVQQRIPFPNESFVSANYHSDSNDLHA